MNKSENCNIPYFLNQKSQHVSRYVLGGELNSFADALDIACVIKNEVESVIGKIIPITSLTDSKSLFDAITKSSSSSKKLLMIELSAVREAYSNHEISDVGYISSKNNPAESLKKNEELCDAQNQNFIYFQMHFRYSSISYR